MGGVEVGCEADRDGIFVLNATHSKRFGAVQRWIAGGKGRWVRQVGGGKATGMDTGRETAPTADAERMGLMEEGSTSKAGDGKDKVGAASLEFSVFGLPMKYLSLLLLVVQNTSNVLVLRASRVQGGARYLSSTAVLMQELLKIPISFLMLAQESGGVFKGMGRASAVVQEEFIGPRPLESAKILVPAVIYTVQNNLLFYALSNLDAPTFQITYQGKILTTALMSMLLLGRSFEGRQWIAMFFLFIGVCVVQLQGEAQSTGAEEHMAEQNRMLGLTAAVVSCFLSGFAGVYLERVLKTGKTSIWLRNIQMASFSLIPATFTVFWQDGDAVRADGFFSGYSSLVWLAISIGSAGGILVAVVVKYADNVLKGFATSVSIVLSSVLSILFMGFSPTPTFITGATIVVLSTAAYQLPRQVLNSIIGFKT